ncbi:hypothetical protein [Flocculibacter collagenilyticus]|uniref:hypothetical protein n=1 Tax=Flocculibacter collagenilyticus TaxID=2744479 RepID=UPI0018F2B64F|nr:hypothetical protein [Flocculibacter collagenilyticus]
MKYLLKTLRKSKTPAIAASLLFALPCFGKAKAGGSNYLDASASSVKLAFNNYTQHITPPAIDINRVHELEGIQHDSFHLASNSLLQPDATLFDIYHLELEPASEPIHNNSKAHNYFLTDVSNLPFTVSTNQVNINDNQITRSKISLYGGLDDWAFSMSGSYISASTEPPIFDNYSTVEENEKTYKGLWLIGGNIYYKINKDFNLIISGRSSFNKKAIKYADGAKKLRQLWVGISYKF